jgi:N-acetylmuramoyl-L-alanine amidase
MAAFCLLAGFLAGWGKPAGTSLRISDLLSPLNGKRPIRPETRYIILHTTEGAEEGSLRKVRRYGEAHYFVTPSGDVYRIIDRARIAAHTGRSMWEGRSTLDNCSIGIEVVGFYNQDITAAQVEALRELLRQLKALYHIPDKNVLTHSMVAYGRPNQFYHSNHRGRKRCGAVFARADVRRRLGLTSQPAQDPDVRAGRLKVADEELERMLYAQAPPAVTAGPATVTPGPAPMSPPSQESPTPAGEGSGSDPTIIGKGANAWSIARESYNHAGTVYVFPDGTRMRGDQIREWKKIPEGTRVLLSGDEPEQEFEGFLEIGKDGDTPRDLAGDDTAEATTIYFLPSGLIRTGAELALSASLRKFLEAPPQGTRILVGYTYGGYVGGRRSAYYVARGKWNYPSTFYRLPDGRILSGDEIDEKMIPARTLIFFQN